MVRLDSLNTIDNVAEAAANPPANRPAARWVGEQVRRTCNWLQRGGAPVRDLARLGSLGGLDLACRPYWEEEGIDPPEYEPPFEGGQCDNINYTVVAQGLNSTGSTVTSTRSGPGPVGGMCFEVSEFNPNNVRIGVSFADGCNFGGAGQGQTSVANQGTWSIISVTPQSGTDDCGDPAPLPVPSPNPAPDPELEPDERPFFDIDGTIIIPIIPITINPTFPIDVSPDFNFEPDFNFGGGGGGPAGANDGAPGDGDSVGGVAGTTTGGEDGEDVDFGPPPEGRVWVGAFVEATVDPRIGNIPGTGPENTVYPAVIGNASLRYSGGRGTAIAIISRWTQLFRPVTSLIVEGCFIQAQPGTSLTVRPVSAIICPEDVCGGEQEDG